MYSTVTIRIPAWLDYLFVWPLLWYRKRKYGFTFRRIDLGCGESTILDVDDFYKFGNLKWTLYGTKKKFYALCGAKDKNGNYIMLRLHRLIMNAPKHKLVDHEKGNSLDNRRANLRLATRSQNLYNAAKRKNTSSRFVGVSFDKRYNLWHAYITHRRKRLFLGYFKKEIDAAHAYDKAALKYRKAFARLNFSQ